MALKRFIDYALGHEGVWFPRRDRHRRALAREHPPAIASPPLGDGPRGFVAASAASSSIRPGSPSAPGRLNWAPRMTAPPACTTRLRASSGRAVRGSGWACCAPIPILPASWPPRAADARSTAEQASAGLDALTDAERATFAELNAAYVARHGFPFIIAVRDHDKAGILARRVSSRRNGSPTTCRAGPNSPRPAPTGRPRRIAATMTARGSTSRTGALSGTAQPTLP
jgi:hypothetical protein